MAIATLDFGAESLGMRTRITAVLPEHPNHPVVLLLLHGLGDDETVWLTQTRLVSYAEQKQVVILMPRVDRSYYANSDSGVRYFDFVSDELLTRCADWLCFSCQPSATFVAGVSMGGYGALKVALNAPTRFAGAFVLSGVTDLVKQWQEHPERDSWYSGLFGSMNDLRGSSSDLPGLVRAWGSAPRPFIRQICGRADPYYQMNLSFQQLASSHGFDCSLETVAGAHEWWVWDQAIQSVLTEVTA
ncbi:alpha/beta hydrolase [Lacticaseibacillus nasuensis]|uniref:alpha/beta hydrolase n=1 Tax=Lacticaseibacillus nasuensis TaxID=944671 RepID=UPI0022475508|nr:alpha/beta hydrolase-fold protein [Lacticaseibacillus nasuensis]MCX2455067.1 alpha/beta hydrolase-fold protein [Lacticaseibacillus nasuensis]